MVETSIARRALGDIVSVSRHARPASAARWLTSFAVHLPECSGTRSLVPADRVWARTGARFRPPDGPVISLPAAYTAGAREMYCRNVYLRAGFSLPRTGWVLDLGANRGLFSVSVVRAGATAGVVADDERWAATSHGAPQRPSGLSVPQIMSAYQIGRIGLMKVDIEGGEFAVFSDKEDLSWLDLVDQVVMEVHPEWGDAAALVDRLRRRGFTASLRDNEGTRVSAASSRLAYAYFGRPSGRP